MRLGRGAAPRATLDQLLLACRDGLLAGSGLARPSDSAGVGFVAPRVLPAFRCDGAGTVLMHALAGHLCELGLPAVRASVAGPGSLAFAARFGFAETDQQIEQVRRIAAESAGVLAMAAGVAAQASIPVSSCLVTCDDVRLVAP